MSHIYRMIVRKYLPEKLYGFASSKEGDAFFHLSAFKHPESLEVPPPPIIGESVDVVLSDPLVQGITLKAQKVIRLTHFHKLKGSVLFFNAKVGFGKIQSKGGEYFLHRSEVQKGKLPMRGDLVSFFAVDHVGSGRPRACHVEIEDKA